MKKVDWDSYEVVELVEMCKKNGLDSTGRRDDLIARLEAHKEEAPPKPPEPPEPEPEPEE